MNRQVFFEEICKGLKTEIDCIAKILMARGFLIEKRGENYFLTDNAHKEDYLFLKELLHNSNSGDLIRSKKTNDDNEGLYEYQLLFNTEVTRYSVINLFDAITRTGDEAFSAYLRWSYIKSCNAVPKVKTKILEPYVAFYVKALGSCCVYTCNSCQSHIGNNQNYIEIDGYSTYFRTWHKVLCEEFLSKFVDLKWEQDCRRILVNDKNLFATYYELYKAACLLYSNRIKIRKIRKEACKDLQAELIREQSRLVSKTDFNIYKDRINEIEAELNTEFETKARELLHSYLIISE